MDIDKIKTIVEMMSEHDLCEFKIESKDSNLCIKRGTATHNIHPSTIMPQITVQPPLQAQPVPLATPPQTEPVSSPSKNTIDAPIVGTFYKSPSPEAPSFIKVGDKISADTVVCIIEAMKVMNEIKAEKSGVVKEILVENAKPVEYGQPLIILE